MPTLKEDRNLFPLTHKIRKTLSFVNSHGSTLSNAFDKESLSSMKQLQPLAITNNQSNTLKTFSIQFKRITDRQQIYSQQSTPTKL